MESSDKELACIRGKSLERIRLLISSYEKNQYERKTFRELADDLRWFLRQKFESDEELQITFNDIRKRHFVILRTIRSKCVNSQSSEPIRENPST